MSEISRFETGTTRDGDADKLDYEGFMSPLVLERFAEYMHKHRRMADGSLRSSDNWQRGMPVEAYMKSLWRHFMDVWKAHRGLVVVDRQSGETVEQDEVLCTMMFNVMGMLHEVLKRRASESYCGPHLAQGATIPGIGLLVDVGAFDVTGAHRAQAQPDR